MKSSPDISADAVTRPVLITGMPGSGKSVAGRVLAALLAAPFVDLDLLYQEVHGITPAAEIRENGETLFRERERVLLKRALAGSCSVIACGGGALASEDAMSLARRRGLVVLLEASLSTLEARLRDASNHPLLEGGKLESRLASLLASRRSCYRLADVSVITDRLSPMAAALAMREVLAGYVLPGYRWSCYPPVFRRAEHCWQEFVELGERTHPVWITPGRPFAHLPRLLDLTVPGRDLFVLGDGDVLDLFGDELASALGGRPHTFLSLPPGEAAKRFSGATGLVQALLDAGATRSSAVLAVGGGSALDAAGFTSSVFMRGIPAVYVPTTLLAAVDAAVGGKCAMDLPGAKNIPGTFRQPLGVYVPLGIIAESVKRPELRDGVAELLKTCLLAGPDSAAMFKRYVRPDGRLYDSRLAGAVRSALEYKMSIVAADEREEGGERLVLNLGHTFGHVVEAASGYRVSHGAAVGWGLVVAARMSVQLGLAPRGFAREVERLATRGGFWPPPKVALNRRAIGALLLDKKRAGDKIRLVLMRGGGKPVSVLMPLEEAKKLMAHCR